MLGDDSHATAHLSGVTVVEGRLTSSPTVFFQLDLVEELSTVCVNRSPSLSQETGRKNPFMRGLRPSVVVKRSVTHAPRLR